MLPGDNPARPVPFPGFDGFGQRPGGTEGKRPIATMASQQGLGGSRRFHGAGAHLDGVDRVGSQTEPLDGARADRDGLPRFPGDRFQSLEIGVEGLKNGDGVASRRQDQQDQGADQRRQELRGMCEGFHGCAGDSARFAKQWQTKCALTAYFARIVQCLGGPTSW